MYVITYSLLENQDQSDEFYKVLSAFTDEVLAEMDDLTHSAVDGYASHRLRQEGLSTRSKEEYGFELLVLGTLWEIYSGDASGLEEVPRQLLTGLARLRRQNCKMKPGADFIRGLLSTIFLSPDLYDHAYKLDVSLKQLDKLLEWLAATGEFNQEVLRLRQWKEYLKTLTDKESDDILATALTFAAWFEDRSEEVLGRYTENVDRYLNELRPEHYWHEDVIFCGRRRVEYHLNMVGAEIMNRAFKERFVKTVRKAVLIPACMRILPAGECKGRTDKNGFHCAGCTAECNIFKLIKLGRKNGFDVQVVSHESSISANRSDQVKLDGDTGVVGIACVLNLISGGWLLDGMDIPAQCVMLDYCGCKRHWNREGMPTQINVRQLERVLELLTE
ncbi:MAG: DUF116 domain-containing protein [Clostridiaceae bacterium]